MNLITVLERLHQILQWIMCIVPGRKLPSLIVNIWILQVKIGGAAATGKARELFALDLAVVSKAGSTWNLTITST